MNIRLVVCVLVFPLLLAGCARAEPDAALAEKPAVEAPAAAPEKSAYAWQTLAILKAGANPLWFEFSGEAGIRRILSPAEASLTEFAPWPYARYCAGVLVSGGGLVLAINRDGFLALAPDSGGTAVYRAADSARWAPYSVSAVFAYENRPAALLSRDAFFAEPAETGPEFPVYVLDENFPRPVGVTVPAFAADSEGQEVNALHRGKDGLWYYRFSRPDSGAAAWFKTADLSKPGEAISQGEYWASAGPEPVPENLPAVRSLAETVLEQAAPAAERPLEAAERPLEAAERPLEAAKPPLQAVVLHLISPDFAGQRTFFVSRTGEFSPNAEFVELFGYCRIVPPGESGPRPDEGGLAFAVLPSGQGFFASDGGVADAIGNASGEKSGEFALPPLPDGFVYTGAGLVGDTLAAVWEEQDEFSIGAAGFLAIKTANAGQ